MKELYDLKDMLCDELKVYGKKGDLTAGSLDVIDKLSHALKSVETIIAMEEADGEYSSRYYYGDRPMNGGNRDWNGTSYARGRRGTKRDSMGRYSRDGEMDEVVEGLRELMNDAPNENVRTEIHKVVKKLESM